MKPATETGGIAMGSTRFGSSALLVLVLGLGGWVLHDVVDPASAQRPLAGSTSKQNEQAGSPTPINLTVVPSAPGPTSKAEHRGGAGTASAAQAGSSSSAAAGTAPARGFFVPTSVRVSGGASTRSSSGGKSPGRNQTTVHVFEHLAPAGSSGKAAPASGSGGHQVLATDAS